MQDIIEIENKHTSGTYAKQPIVIVRGQAHTASGEETASEAPVEVWLKIKAYIDSFNSDKQKVR